MSWKGNFNCELGSNAFTAEYNPTRGLVLKIIVMGFVISKETIAADLTTV